MSQPTFPQIDPSLTREESLNEIISSIAAEELSLSHLLNAEGEKLQYILGTLPGLDETATIEEVLRVNRSVQDTMSGIAEQQMMLSSKLSAARGCGSRRAGWACGRCHWCHRAYRTHRTHRTRRSHGSHCAVYLCTTITFAW